MWYRLGCLRKWLLEFRESRNFIWKWSYFREISSNFVYFRITFYTTFRIIWHDFHTKFCIPSNKNLTTNKCLRNLGLYFVLILYKNKRRQKLKKGTKGIVIKTLHNSQLSLQNTVNIVILRKNLLKFESGSEKYIFEWYTNQKKHSKYFEYWQQWRGRGWGVNCRTSPTPYQCLEVSLLCVENVVCAESLKKLV